jgi:hypothetical protein
MGARRLACISGSPHVASAKIRRGSRRCRPIAGALTRRPHRTCTPSVAKADNPGWSLYGAPWLQPVAKGRKSRSRRIREIKPKPLPPVATTCREERMVRRGSTVRVRQRALQKPAQAGFCMDSLCISSTTIGCGAVSGTPRFRGWFRHEISDAHPNQAKEVVERRNVMIFVSHTGTSSYPAARRSRPSRVRV